jgi:hypothetical protein
MRKWLPLLPVATPAIAWANDELFDVLKGKHLVPPVKWQAEASYKGDGAPDQPQAKTYIPPITVNILIGSKLDDRSAYPQTDRDEESSKWADLITTRRCCYISQFVQPPTLFCKKNGSAFPQSRDDERHFQSRRGLPTLLQANCRSILTGLVASINDGEENLESDAGHLPTTLRRVHNRDIASEHHESDPKRSAWLLSIKRAKLIFVILIFRWLRN